jgi:DNA gyrase subunit B
MEELSKLQERIASLRQHVRAKPGMYFGCGGSMAIPRMLNELAVGILSDMEPGRRVRLAIKFDESADGMIAFRVDGAVCRTALLDPAAWYAWGGLLGMNVYLAAAEEFTFRVVDRRQAGEWRGSDRSSIRFRRLKKKGPPGISLTMRLPGTTFGTCSNADFSQLGSMLRDQAILHPALSISLRKGRSAIELAWLYPEGLKSLVAEMDYSRWSLHPDSLSFHGERDGMKVEGAVRFVHSGIPVVRSWVNFCPTQGGAHYEGLGRALKKLFPDANAGCRRVTFETNSDNRKRVQLPHSFVAALHVQLPDPRYYAPTKDILIGDEVRDFVCDIASAALPEQWEELRRQRDSTLRSC